MRMTWGQWCLFKCINSPSQNWELLPCGDGTNQEDIDRLGILGYQDIKHWAFSKPSWSLSPVEELRPMLKSKQCSLSTVSSSNHQNPIP